MPDELLLQLTATPTLKLPNIGLGDLSARSETSRTELRRLASMAQRREWTRDGFAMRDGSFPIPTVSMLRTALEAYTFAEDRQRARRWIIRRARAMDRTDVLPESWGVEPSRNVAAAAGANHTGVMVAIYPPRELAAVLAGSHDGDESPDELHVTLAYLGDSSEFTPDQLEDIKEAVSHVATLSKPMQASVQGFGSFVSPEGDDPRWWSVDAVGLAAMRTLLVLSLESMGIRPRVDHDFTPHMTVRYGAEELSAIPEGGDTPWPVTDLHLVVAGDRTSYALGEDPDFDEEKQLAAKQEWLAQFKGNNNLETYWKAGKGAAKIRWGTPGDFTRCHKHLAKHVDPGSANRICAQWHHDMNGIWPGDKKNLSVLDFEEGNPMDKTITAAAAAEWDDSFQYFWDPDGDVAYRVNDGTVEQFTNGSWNTSSTSEDDVKLFPIVDDQPTLEAIVGAALEEGSDAKDALPEGAGRRFRIPIVIPEGVPSGDRRSFARDALEFKEPPMPLLWQKETGQGHDGSVTVGKITHIERIDGGLGNAEGVFDTHPDAVEAARQVKERFLTGVSGDVDQFEAELSTDDEGAENIHIKHGRLVAATLVAKPAFQEATIEFVTEGDEEPVLVASAGPLNPPAAWFSNPNLKEPTHLTVDDDGRVFGHIAVWGTEHAGNPSIKPPRSRTNYKYFNRLPVRTAEGKDVFCGNLTLTGGHASLDMDAERAMAHYDDTRSAVADVVAGEDQHGIWVAGAMRSDITEHQVRAFRASDPSGDWRMKPEGLELIAVCQVNVPGFPVTRPATLVASGAQLSLVAAGSLELRGAPAPGINEVVASLVERVATLETERANEKRAALLNEITSLRDL